MSKIIEDDLKEVMRFNRSILYKLQNGMSVKEQLELETKCNSIAMKIQHLIEEIDNKEKSFNVNISIDPQKIAKAFSLFVDRDCSSIKSDLDRCIEINYTYGWDGVPHPYLNVNRKDFLDILINYGVINKEEANKFVRINIS